MSVFDNLPLTNIRCLDTAPDGKRCKYVAPDELDMERHAGRHADFHNLPEPRWWDNCAVCGNVIRITWKRVLRIHGHPARRCPGAGQRGTFARRCRLEAPYLPGHPLYVEPQP